ncbi:cobalamin-binding protein [Thiocapsa imhoffii]|uniref:Cobalamin-binding protein n=1 Tax=Thiocapsa imhoffii TaxID=382777 RepID=A0A9X1BA14_9GAMM|nr:cobalamin-dependent protein [Thiocapsa imhoffii]MBK1645606.1 cobalamin-binding protein [Thiocapsa imhoffii]
MAKTDHAHLRVSVSAAQAYEAHAADLASRVSRLLLDHPVLKDFCATQHYRLIESNHRNHASFMAEILRTDNFDLLIETLPWVYFTYHNQGVPFAYFEAEFAAWISVLEERLTPAEAAPLTCVYRWMQQRHPKTVQAAQTYQVSSQVASCTTPHATAVSEIIEQLLAGEHGVVLGRCENLLRQGMVFPQLLQTIFYPAMIEVGRRWEQGRVSVAMEHQATAMTYRILSSLYSAQPYPTTLRGKAIVAAVANEFHELGAWMVTTCLELDGWEVTLLGPDTSTEMLVRTVLEEQPAFIGLSVCLPSHVQAARDTVQALRGALGPATDTKILVGGRAFLTAPALIDSVGGDLFLSDCEAAVRWARTLRVAA